ncbi:MAG: hypothetical protein CVV03_11225 [Firmicutes bacterium HGW-Firmicutes-8]|nr:MAG: hypothetical protein CVV03_11225 [Firmicutes bacterium HGW-Firmicutes-8]
MKQKEFQEFVINSLTSLKNDVSSLNIRTTEQEKLQDLTVKHLTKLSERMTSVESTVLRIETRMENKIIDKIKGLFDGHQQHEDRLEQHESRLNHIEKIAR